MRLPYLNNTLLTLASLVLAPIWSQSAFAYEKAVEGADVVKDKLFPKKSAVQLDGKFGMVLNGSYIQTFLLNGGLTYYWSENWGFNLEGIFALNSDKAERACIETFYNDPNFAINSQCGSSANLSQDSQGDANFGPAYVPIREIQYMGVGNFVWNPIYGKQLVFLSFTTYFDFFVSFGGGLAISKYYPEQSNFPDDGGTDAGKPQRGVFCTKAEAAKPNGCSTANNPGTTDESRIGIVGRPQPLSQNNIVTHLSVGQRFHFMKRFELLASLDNYTLIGTPQTFDTYLTLFGGLGVRF